MIQITPQMRILIAVEPIDFRKGIDGLVSMCREKLHEDPFSGYIFIFRNKRFHSLKILMYDGQGFWLMQKRLSQGRYQWWPKESSATINLSAVELQVLLWNGDLKSVKVAPDWRSIKKK